MNFAKENRAFPRRLLSLLLSLIMLLSLFPAALGAELPGEDPVPAEEPVSDAELLPEEELPAEEEDLLPEEEPAGEETDPLPEEDVDSLPEEELPDQGDAPLPEEEAGDETAPVTPSADEGESGEEQLPPEEETEDPLPVPQLLITETDSLELDYDDRWTVEEDWEIVSIVSDEITSFQVKSGRTTTTPDANVLVYDGDGFTGLVASGVGTATVLLAPAEEAETVRTLLEEGVPVLTEQPDDTLTGDGTLTGDDTLPADDTLTGDDAAGDLLPNQETEPGQETDAPRYALRQLSVTVSPARLALFILAGQSNMEGICGFRFAPQDSVLCPEGEVYSTYAGKDDDVTSITGIKSFYPCTTSNINTLIPSSLTGTASLAGSTLVYPLNALTVQGKGKTGPDGALAYEWNRLTGEKVWVVNCAFSGSPISYWVPGGAVYERNQTFLSRIAAVYNAEISAGHYTGGNRILYWMQGESDPVSSVSEYLKGFQAVQSNLTSLCGIEYTGFITVRNYNNTHLDDTLDLSAPRIAQYYMSSSTSWKNTYVVSNVNEQWETSSGITRYFSAAYPSGRPSYPLRSTSSLSSLPVSTLDIHDNAHFTQIAHNENGLDAARNMYHVVYGGGSNDISVTWHNARYIPVTSLSVLPKKSAVLVPVVYPLYRSKQVTIRSSSSNFIYNAVNGTVTVPSSGSAVISAYANGTAISSVNVTATTNTIPVLNSISVVSNGLKLTWNAYSGASGYYVFRKTENSSWTTVGSVTGTSFVDTTVQDSTYYTYTIRAVCSGVLSDYDRKGLSLHYLAPLSLTVSNTSNGVSLYWGSSGIAPAVWIYRRTANSSWERIYALKSSMQGCVDKTAVPGVQYYYFARKVLGINCSDSPSCSIVCLTVPNMVSAVNRNGSVRVQWQKVTGAAGYIVFRKAPGENWKTLATLSGGSVTSYEDKSVYSNTTYTYTVRATKNRSMSYFDTAGLTVTYLAPPVIRSLSNSANGIVVSWNAVAGAAGYELYRKTDSSSWVFLGYVTDGSTQYVDTSPLTSGTTYTYMARAYNSSGRSYYNSGRSLLWLDTPVLTAVSSRDGYISLSWQKVSGAAGYTVFRKTPTSGWITLGSVSANTLTYSDKAVSNNTSYTYTVRAKYGSLLSGFDPKGISLTYLTCPTVKSISNAPNGLVVTWHAVMGASSYQLFRKTPGSRWVLIDTITDGATSYTDTAPLSSGTTYVYTLRAVSDTGYSYFNAGRSQLRLDTPVLQQAANYAASTTIRWEQIPGASGYYVCRRTPATGWTTLATVSGNTLSYTDTKVTSGTTYIYTVRAYHGSVLSSYDASGLTNHFLSPPVLTSVSSAAGGMKVCWTPRTGAAGYRIFRKTPSTNWVILADVSGEGTSAYLDTEPLQTGTSYIYAVRALTENNPSYYTASKATVYVETPSQLAASPTENGIEFTWNPVSGATGYMVFRRSDTENWRLTATLKDGAASSWTDTALLDPDSNYYYTVRACWGSTLSGFDSGTPVIYPQ